ncbi:MAG: hypothetical protein HYX74_10995 [Acidobacteria bacterium]|nr:hypothetical protein [Acidobacteriota bacterium]
MALADSFSIGRGRASTVWVEIGAGEASLAARGEAAEPRKRSYKNSASCQEASLAASGQAAEPLSTPQSGLKCRLQPRPHRLTLRFKHPQRPRGWYNLGRMNRIKKWGWFLFILGFACILAGILAKRVFDVREYVPVFHAVGLILIIGGGMLAFTDRGKRHG